MVKNNDILDSIYLAMKRVNKSFQEFLYLNKEDGNVYIKYYERVWCYEFYKRFDIKNYNFNAEVPKLGNLKYKNLTPDFILHRQGHEENLCAIEVKTDCKNYKGVSKDFNTLFTMIKDLNYKIGVIILININKNFFMSHILKSKAVFSILEKNSKLHQNLYVFTKDKDGKIEYERLDKLITIN